MKITIYELLGLVKDGKQIIIGLNDCENTYLYEFNEDDVYCYEIARIL